MALGALGIGQRGVRLCRQYERDRVNRVADGLATQHADDSQRTLAGASGW